MQPTTVVRVAARGVLNSPSRKPPGTCEASITYRTPGGWRLAHRTGFPSAPIYLPVEDVLLRIEAARHGLSGVSAAVAVFEASILQEGAMIPLMRAERRAGYIVVRRMCAEFDVTEIVLDVFVYASCGRDDLALVMKAPPKVIGIDAEELVKVSKRGVRVRRGLGLMSLLRWLRGGEKVRQEAALSVLQSVAASNYPQHGMYVRGSQ